MRGWKDFQQRESIEWGLQNLHRFRLHGKGFATLKEAAFKVLTPANARYNEIAITCEQPWMFRVQAIAVASAAANPNAW